MNRGEKRGMGRQGSPCSANKNWDLAGKQKRIHIGRRETNSTTVFVAEVFLLRPERGCRAEIRAQFLSTEQKHSYVCRAHCERTERPSGPGSVNATVLVQTVSCLLNCNVTLSICNLWTASFQFTCLTARSCLRWHLRHLSILFSLLLLPFSSQCTHSGKGGMKKQCSDSQAPS